MVSIVIGYEGFDKGLHTFIVRGVAGMTYSFTAANYEEYSDKVISAIERVCNFCGLPPDGTGLHAVIEFIPD